MTDAIIQESLSWPEKAKDFTEAELMDAVRKYDLVIVDCWIARCKYSIKMGPIFDALAKEISGKAAFGKVDLQQNHHVPVKYRIKATPTFLIFKKGELVERIVGETSKDELARIIIGHLDYVDA